ncbi:hypothetical protein [Alsobacter sp. R-9]
MHLGQILKALDDEGFAAAALAALGDVVLLAEVQTMREHYDETPGEYVANASRRFATLARDDDWLALMNAMERHDEPARIALTHMVRWALAADAADRVAGDAPAPANGDAAQGCGSGRRGCGNP